MKHLTSGILLPGIALAAGACSNNGEKRASPRPNILFCIADDASYHHFGATGCTWVNTPAFDRVASEGLLFHNCYTPNAKSAPSRASILTGRYSWQLEEAGNHGGNFPANYKVFTEALFDHGYRVAFTGKGWAPGYPGEVAGKPRMLTGEPYQDKTLIPPTRFISDTDYAGNFVNFLDEQAEGEPWFFWYGGREPHRKYEYGTGDSLGGKKTVMLDRVPGFWPDNPTVRNDMLDYGFEIEHFDSHLGMMLDELKRRGELENTIVIVTSDNGMPFPRSKANNYEYSHHMPMAVMWPEGIRKPGRQINDYVNFVDLAATILDAARVNDSGMQALAGESWRPIFESRKQGRVVKHRDRLIFGRERDDYGRPDNQGYPIRGIIRDGLLYIWNLKPERHPAGNPETGYLDIDGSPTKSVILDMWRTGTDTTFYELSMGKRPSEELYDLDADIDCLRNLSGDSAYAARKAAMRSELEKVLIAQRDPRMTGEYPDIFDNYPFSTESNRNFYERVVSGEITEPWEQTGWVNPTDYDAYVSQSNDRKIVP
jgi:arylsulfatase A-like enzyme